ncbi:muskelin-like isoform X2 [Stegodyphus dumicola]|uniref:muskelin-like isoform X2 n=1 Tax=Stegodyphus dumicola TaxID=202533 RepID=UPI0015AD1453|nr:muskelin-like isoform X2 [Stegodyphus dumicola]
MGEQTILKYCIHKYSSHSATFVPENILTDEPKDGTSRWSSESNNPPQFLILKLFNPAVVQVISFGKYEKSHVCNMKKFKVYGGLSDDSMIELLYSGLKNNNQTESFNLKHTAGENMFACRYIKIVPIQSWGPSFNFSIWHVQLKGIEDWNIVKSCVSWFSYYREREAIRLCLKHFRQHNYTEAFESLQKRTRVQLEDALLTKLHQCLVIDGDYISAEKLLIVAAEEGYLDHYLIQQTPKPKWVPLIPSKSSENTSSRPGMRGGHQMCIDVYSEIIYLFGGWDGTTDLADLWSYHIPTGTWTCLSQDTSCEGGPSPRSCHKMCLDPERKKIFTLGRYLDSVMRASFYLNSDFYVYDIDSNQWTLITDDTEKMGGPSLVFDHQMCIDVEKNTIYVFGGRVVTSISPSSPETVCAEPVYCGLYSYHVPTNTWCKLRSDMSKRNPSDDISKRNPNDREIKSRIGHSMLFHEKSRLLYIFAGQRNRAREYLNDFFAYNVDTNQITIICDGSDTEFPPLASTARATIDPELDEIHVLCGSNRDKREEYVKDSFWVYDINHNKWSCIYQKCVKDQENATKTEQPSEPCPRFAHQLVYDHIRKIHYMFGGNPGKVHSPNMRLDDFWSLQGQ